MSQRSTPQGKRSFPAGDPSSCRIETRGGTVYWLSGAGQDGARWIVREQLQSSLTNTMIMQKSSLPQEVPDLGDKFRGKLLSDVEEGQPFTLELDDTETRILSEPVVAVEVGEVPEMLFR